MDEGGSDGIGSDAKGSDDRDSDEGEDSGANIGSEDQSDDDGDGKDHSGDDDGGEDHSGGDNDGEDDNSGDADDSNGDGDERNDGGDDRSLGVDVVQPEVEEDDDVSGLIPRRRTLTEGLLTIPDINQLAPEAIIQQQSPRLADITAELFDRRVNVPPTGDLATQFQAHE